MKHAFSRITLVGFVALALTFSACDLTEMNEDPNEPDQVTTPNLLAGALHSEDLPERFGLAANYWGDFTLGRFANLYAQYWTQNQYTDEDRYAFPAVRSSVVNDMWEDYYFVLNDLEEIKRVNRQNPEAASAYGAPENQIAIATILQAWTFQVLTDTWGPVPFMEALQGREQGEFSPAYSSQEEIYRGLLDSLTMANEMIDTGSPALASGDLVYGGDMSQWKKFANSLKMRVAIRIADVLPELSQQAIQEAIAAGPLESNADNALIPFNPSPPYQNPIYENYEVEGRDDWAVTETLLGIMNANEDPRRPAYAESVDGEYIGYPYGLEGGAAQSRYRAGPFSRPSQLVRQPDASAILMLYDEVLFIEAEAAQRGFISGDPAGLYEDAIRASMAYWGVEDQAAIDAYIANVPYNASSWQEVLGTQKWIALYMQGVQGWAEWRRLDFGVLQPPAGGALAEVGPEGIPLRLTYPLDEANLNEANLNEAVQNLLGADSDNQGARLWWDVN